MVFRADSGFFVGALMDFPDAGSHGDLIKVKLRGLVQLSARQHWTPIRHQPGWEQCEFSYRANGWTQERFLVAVRCRKAPAADHPQGRLRASAHKKSIVQRVRR